MAVRIPKKLAALARLLRTLGPLNLLRYKIQRLRMRFRRPDQLLSLRVPGAPHPLWFRPQTSDLDVFHLTFVRRQYETLDTSADVRFVIDGGANAGYVSVWFLLRHPNASVVAIEPDPANADLLERNLKPYGDRARVVRSAIWSHPTGMVLRSAGDGRAWAWQVRESASWEPADMTATDIGTLLAESGQPRISILKLRVEGAEREIFADGDSEWLARTDTIAIELHDAECRGAFLGAVADYPFRITDVGELTFGRLAG